MTQSPQERYRQELARVAEEYRRRGYQVSIEPVGDAVPEFLAGFRPDIIARSDQESVVVEVKVGVRMSAVDRYQELAQRVNAQPGWRFDLVYVDVAQVSGTLPDLSEIGDRTARAQNLLASGDSEAAFLLLWGSLEALLRLLAERLRLPVTTLPPSALLRELYSAGELGRDAYSLAMDLLALRNSLVHGFSAQVDENKIRRFAAVVATLMQEMHGDAEGST
jgi:hypothetical protein